MKTVRIGRESCNDRVINDFYVSRMSHCEITQHDDGTFSIIDKSKNGTYVDGMRIGFGVQVPLREFSIVRIGNTTLPWRSYFESEDNHPIPRPKTWLAEGVIATVFFSLLLGILCIVYASKVDRLWEMGDKEGAREKSRKAGTLFWWAFGLGMLRIVTTLILF